MNAMKLYSLKHGQRHMIKGVAYAGTNPVYEATLIPGQFKKVKAGIPFVRV